MTSRTWVIVGATSIIAEKYAQLVAQAGDNLLLVGRQEEQLALIANDIKLRYQVDSETLIMDLEAKPEKILSIFKTDQRELDLFIAHSNFTENKDLNIQSITELINTNIQATILLIYAYLNRPQNKHNLIYLSSVAACRGRAKNSLYGASKACIEIYLQGLQQAASASQKITIARLGFIDTKQTYGLPGIFYAGAPENCAKSCRNALKRSKHLFYFPFFWRGIMAVMTHLPFFIYKKMSEL